MSLVEHAQLELDRAGLNDKDAEYDGLISNSVMALIKTHAEQGHSGGSHATTIAIFNKLVNFEPLTPVSKEDFVEITQGLWQCRRASNKFSIDAGETWYDIEKPLRFRSIRRFFGLRTFRS